MDIKYSTLLRTAFDAYLVRWDAGDMGPPERYLPYDFEQIDRHRWSLFGAEMVKDELRELTNLLNHWLGSLRRWRAWNSIIAGYEQEDAWELRREFLEALAHQCLLLPSAMRDTFTFVATNSMHQVLVALTLHMQNGLNGELLEEISRDEALEVVKAAFSAVSSKHRSTRAREAIDALIETGRLLRGDSGMLSIGS